MIWGVKWSLFYEKRYSFWGILRFHKNWPDIALFNASCAVDVVPFQRVENERWERNNFFVFHYCTKGFILSFQYSHIPLTVLLIIDKNVLSSVFDTECLIFTIRNEEHSSLSDPFMFLVFKLEHHVISSLFPPPSLTVLTQQGEHLMIWNELLSLTLDTTRHRKIRQFEWRYFLFHVYLE
jgi:hypothetical protein